MKKVKEEARLNILLMKSQMDNLELQRQNADAGIHNLILQEASRLNIPQGWHYDFQSGEFCSPEELEARQKQLQAGQQEAPGPGGPPIAVVPNPQKGE